MSKLNNWQKLIIGEIDESEYNDYFTKKFNKKKPKAKKKKFKLKED
jgi:hypothetical protein